MELAEFWDQAAGGVCQIVHTRNGVRLGSGSGFLTKDGVLVTNNHVIQPGNGTSVTVRFVGPDGHTVTTEREFSGADFQARVQDGEPEASWDFAVLNMAVDEFAGLPALDLAPEDDTIIGSPVALLGFQFEQANLSIHSGVIASKYQLAGVDYLQLDASVNHGNSGGPLVDLASGHVVGVVTRKATGLTTQFDELLASFDANIKAFEAVQGSVGLSGIDVFQVLTITQIQMKSVAAEISRSANVGIGYAYSLKKVRSSLTALGVL